MDYGKTGTRLLERDSMNYHAVHHDDASKHWLYLCGCMPNIRLRRTQRAKPGELWYAELKIPAMPYANFNGRRMRNRVKNNWFYREFGKCTQDPWD